MVAMAMALLLAVSLLAVWRRRQTGQTSDRRSGPIDSTNHWAPAPARVLSVSERRALALVQQAAPGFLVLAQVPLSRFLRVPLHKSQREWLRHVGHVNADLLLCDSGSQVLAVIDVRAKRGSVGSERRHRRMLDLLEDAGIPTLVWYDDALPGVSDARNQLVPLMASVKQATGPVSPPVNSRPMPLIPIGDISEVLSEGDTMEFDAAMEPVPSAMFDDFDIPAGSSLR